MKFLLVSDLDNTWIGNDLATIALQQKLLPYRDQFSLIYATGRSVSSVMQLMRDFWLVTKEKLLEPDYLITGVGSEIYHRGMLDYVWAEQISLKWNRNAIATLTKALPQLLPQSESEQNPWKISFFLAPAATPSILVTLRQKILRNRLQANIVFSSGLDVDILPHTVDKGLAAMYLREKLHIPLNKTLVCGDSGNDLSLYQHSTLGLIVNNAKPELSQWHTQHPSSNHYLAQSSYAWGILEAINYFGLLPNL